MKKPLVVHIFPPIPDRRFDWAAYWDGEEESGHVGYGPTAAEALADLSRLDEERAEAAAEAGDRLICLHGRWQRP